MKISNSLSVQKQQRLTDKAFNQSLAVSVLSIILCLVVLTGMTWAWFSGGINSSSNNISSANCKLEISIMNGSSVVSSVDGKYTLLKDTPYEIKITATGTANSAYCVVNVNGVDYYTSQIPTKQTNINGTTVPNYITFTLQFTADTTAVEFIPHWGTSSKQDRAFVDGGNYLNTSSIEVSG